MITLLDTAIDELAVQALMQEVMLTPKPGLVDRHNNGAHRDMDMQTFLDSISAITPWFERFYQLGRQYAQMPAGIFLPMLRAEGVCCEAAMFAATHGVNTHKGGIFSLGLLCAAGGRLSANGQKISAKLLCTEIVAICRGIVEADLGQLKQAVTHGEHLYQRYGLAGARGEAASGYATVQYISLPVYRRLRAAGHDEETALLQALLHLLAYNQDTNLVTRGGIEGLYFVQKTARKLLAQGGVLLPEGREQMAAFDDALIQRNLSPGGSADLLAVTWLLAQLEPILPITE